MKTNKSMTMSPKPKCPAVLPETGPSKYREAFAHARRRPLTNPSAAKIAGSLHEIDAAKLDPRLVDTAAPVAARLNSIFMIVTQTGHVVAARVFDEAPDILRRDRASPLFHTATENAQGHPRHYRQAN
jgi:hypothetical protein